ncbi:DUF2225 domain-containing protein [Pseudoalteromonas fenneropenaei]|uniref:DUF2225 domain-containing protein n=1 Tax=Pseudoalteromonas fenneropenaei TaxID=1737459 RepID=A0ABV7CGB3_9GAMM
MQKIPFKSKKTLSLLVGFLFSHLAFAEIDYSASQLELQAPSIAVPVFNYRDRQVSLAIASHEAGFMSDIKPLLAKQQYQQVAEAFASRPLEKDSAALQQMRGQVLLTLKRYDEAVQALTAAVQQAPELVGAQRSLALAYILNQQPQQARAPMLAAISLGANDAALFGQLAYLNLQSYGPWSAIAGYRQALFLEPENSQWQKGLLHALTQAHAFAEAEALLKELINKQPDNPDWWLQQSYLALSQQAYSNALQALEVAMRMNSAKTSQIQTMRNYLLLAKLHVQYGSVNQALFALEQATTRADKSDSSELNSNIQQLSRWFAAEQQWDALQSLFNVVEKAKLNDLKGSLWLAKAQLAIAKKRHTEAEQLLISGITAEPSNGQGLLMLAALYKDKGNLVDAINYYQRASTIESSKEAALLGQAQLEIDRKGYQAAINLLRQVLNVNPARQELRANIKNLEQLLRYEG